MKKFFPIIFGVLIGTFASLWIVMTPPVWADDEEEFEPDTIAEYFQFDWNDIFNPSQQGQNMYDLTYNKLLERPENDALKEVAQKYGLTKDEAKKVVDGSAAPIFNNPRVDIDKLTQDEALRVVQNLQNDFSDAEELFGLQQELALAIEPSELFSNGDLSDSGFDLVHDLTVIEEILFVENTPTTVGGNLGNALDKPFLPTDPNADEDIFIPAEADAEVYTLGSELTVDEEEGTAELEIGEEASKLEILEADVCPVPGLDLEEALAAYEGRSQALEEDDDDGDGRVARDGSAEQGPDLSTEEGRQEALEILPDAWGGSFCPIFDQIDPNVRGASSFGDDGFSSLGNAFDSLLGESAGVRTGFVSEGFDAHIALCLETQLIYKTVSSYAPGTSCIACEVEKINEILNKTLYHSLVPNKVTGNIMESAKCKQSYGDFLDIQFITIAAPIPTPANDDLIFGSNIFEEWNTFVEDYHPFLTLEKGVSFEIQNALDLNPQGTPVTQESFLQELDALQSTAAAQVRASVDNVDAISEGTNFLIYSQGILRELRQMNAFFEHFKDLYDDINTDICPAFNQKPILD